jgi:hypothetical protein
MKMENLLKYHLKTNPSALTFLVMHFVPEVSFNVNFDQIAPDEF